MDKKTDEVVARQEITEELVNLVNECFDKYYGLCRRANRPAPNIDANIDRRYLKYDGLVNENKKIFRR